MMIYELVRDTPAKDTSLWLLETVNEKKKLKMNLIEFQMP